jgi:hypothetical protein
MELKDAKNRSPEVRAGDKGSQLKGESTGLGTVPTSSGKLGDYQVGITREDSIKSNTADTGEQSISGITGEITSELINETEKQLAYYQEQVDSLQQRLRDLRKISEIPTRTDNSE